MRLGNLIRDQIKGLWVTAYRSGAECERGAFRGEMRRGQGFAPRQKANTPDCKAQEGRGMWGGFLPVLLPLFTAGPTADACSTLGRMGLGGLCH